MKGWQKKQNIKVWLFGLIILVSALAIGAGTANASGKYNVYLFSDGVYTIGTPYRENTKLVAMVRTSGTNLDTVKSQIKYQNHMLVLNGLKEENLYIYTGNILINGDNSVKELKICCKTKITQIQKGGKLLYTIKRGKTVSLGSNVGEYEKGYYCTIQEIDASPIQTAYVPNGTVAIGAKLSVPASGGGKLEYTSSNENVVKVNANGSMKIMGAGSANITITALDNGPYKTVSKTIPVTIDKAVQTISGENGVTYTKTYGNADFSVKRTTVSQGKVYYSSNNPSVAAVSADGVVSIKKKGTAVITIWAPETSNYKAAVPKTVTVNISPAVQTITGVSSAYRKTYGDAAFTIAGKTNGDGKLVYKSSKTSVATVDGNGKVTIKGVGETKITVSAAATDTYKEAVKKEAVVTVNQASQTITVKETSYTKKKSSAAFHLGAKFTGGTKLVYKSDNTKVAKVDGNGKVTIVDYGKARITISAAGNANYKAASSKTVSITVIPGTPAISSAKSPASKQIEVMWKKVTDATGYRIHYATKSDFSNAKATSVSGAASVSKTITGLSAKKKYYVRVQAYKTANGTTTYSSYSSTLTVTTK